MKRFLSCVLLAVTLLFSPTVFAQNATTQGKIWEFVMCAGGFMSTAGCPNSGSPYLLFSDLDDGPDTGLGDGYGSGAIVTVWGFNLCPSQTVGEVTVKFTDAGLNTRTNGYIYYCKNADGVTPSGPANLYESHGIQELAFSVPDSDVGNASITITNGVGDSVNTLPFLVRSGNIFHVKSTGAGGNSGSFNSPWVDVNDSILALAQLGEIIYVHDIYESTTNTGTDGWYWDDFYGGTIDNQAALVSYPGYHPSSSAQRSINVGSGNGGGIVFSKLTARPFNTLNVDANGQPISYNSSGESRGIRTSKDGRVVGNYVKDRDGGCSSDNTGGGAIQGNARNFNAIENAKVFGNEIEGYGCQGTHQQMHTTYFSIRNASGITIPAPEVAYNYLHDNWAKNGIHFFDQDVSGAPGVCGNFTTELEIHNNVIINQGSAGIAVGESGCNTWNVSSSIYNNVIIDAGWPSYWDGVDPSSATSLLLGGIGLGGNTNYPDDVGNPNNNNYPKIYNNTIIGWEPLELTDKRGACLVVTNNSNDLIWEFRDNVCLTSRDRYFLGYFNSGSEKLDDSTANSNGNVFYYSGVGSPTEAIVPSFDASPITTDPLLSINGVKVEIIGESSPVLNNVSGSLDRDIYGKLRDNPDYETGAVEK